MYVLFGGATTLVNWSVYAVLVKFFSFGITAGNTVAWFAAVLFAFITNKLFVFQSKSFKLANILKESVSFFGSRLITGIIEILAPQILFSLGVKGAIFGVEGFVAKIAVSVLVIVLNYIFSKLFVFKDNTAEKKSDFPLYFISFVVPAVIITLLFFVTKCVPFGNNSVAIEDANIQYLDFFQYLRNVLTGEDSFLYSTSHFLGGTGIATLAYYLSSPFNILILLFNKGQEVMFYHLLVVLKIATAGVTMCCYLKNRTQKLNPIFTVLLSSSYALMQYSFLQTSNIMWLDGLYMLPIILLGVYKIVNTGESKTFVVSLCLSILFNWYTGYFNCVAVFVYFFFELFIANDGKLSIKSKFTRLFSIAIRSVVGIALSAFLFLPSSLGLSSGKGQLSLSLKNTFSGNILSIFSGLATGSKSSYGNLVLFCGSLAFIGTVLYFLSRAISVKEKAVGIICFFAMLMTVFYYPAETFINGFRGVYSYLYRHAYIIVFYLILFAAKAFENLEKEQCKNIVLSGGICATLLLFSNYGKPTAASEKMYETIFIILVLSYILYKTVELLQKETSLNSFIQKWGTKALSFLLIAVIFGELTLDGYQVYKNRGFLSQSYEEYSENQNSIIGKIKDLDTSFFRIAKTKYRGEKDNISACYNDSLAYTYNSITNYTSTNEATQNTMMYNLGYVSSDMNLSTNQTRILSSDSLLGVKYIITDEEIKGLTLVNDIPQIGDERVYLNPYRINTAFVYKGSNNMPVYEGNPFDYQNALFSQLTNSSTELFTKLDVPYSQIEECTVLTVPELAKNEIGYVYFVTSKNINSNMYINDEMTALTSYWNAPNTYMIPAEQGDTEIKFSKTGDGSVVKECSYYVLNLDSLKKISDILNKNSTNDIFTGNGKISFDITAKEGERLGMSVPASKGWTVKINGKQTDDISKISDCLFSLGLNEGENHIEMVYKVPGLNIGICISGFALLLCVGYLFIKRKIAFQTNKNV